MPTTRLTRAAFTGLGGVSLAVILAGCAPAAAEPQAEQDAGAPVTTSGEYADGDYAATGEYQSPGGDESIEVELSLAGNSVTAVTVTPTASEGNAERYQTQFAEGIEAEVVGKNIDELAVDRVAGSSLTSEGFNDALEQIKADAAA